MTKKDKYILYKCVKFAKDKFGVKTPFKLKLSDKRGDEFKTFAYYSPEEKLIAVYTKNRAIPDICRSACHELFHHFQNQNGEIKGQNQDIGGKIEDDANAKAGAVIKEFGYMLKDTEDIDIYNL